MRRQTIVFQASFNPSKSLPSNSKMAQYIRTPCVPDFNNVSQVTQCSYHDERVFEIFYDNANRRVLVQEYHDYFWITSPDIDNITIYQTLEALGYAGEQIVVTWTSDDQNGNLLNSIVEQAPLSQLAIYGPNQNIPLNPHQGPLPAVAGEPIPDAADEPDDDDDNSTLSDMPNYRIVDQFNDSDNERD